MENVFTELELDDHQKHLPGVHSGMWSHRHTYIQMFDGAENDLSIPNYTPMYLIWSPPPRAPAKIIDEPAIKKLPVPDNFGHRVGGELRKEKSPLILG